MLSFPTNTDPDLPSAIARWKATWDPECLSRTGIPGDDFRAIVDPSTPLAQYQALLDKYKPQLLKIVQLNPQAWQNVYTRQFAYTDSYQDLQFTPLTLFSPVTYLNSSYHIYAVINGAFYLPGAYLVPGVSFGGVDPIAQGLSQNFVTSSDNSTSPPFTLMWAVLSDDPVTGEPYKNNGFTATDSSNSVYAANLYLVKYSASGNPFQYLDLSDMTWKTLNRHLPDPIIPVSPQVTVDAQVGTAITIDDAKQAVVESGFFKLRTDYLLIGDEPVDKTGGLPPGVFDLKSILSDEQYQTLREYFTMMPRSMLYNFFMDKVWPSIPWDMYSLGTDPAPSDRPLVTSQIYGESHVKKQYEDLVWGAFIDLFNDANLEYVTKNQLEPWTWEGQKTDGYYVSSNQDALNQLASQLQQYQDIALALDPQAQKIMQDYSELPKLGDLGMEINRQNAIKELLKRKDYVTAQAIVDAYRYAKDTVLGDTLTQPIPFDIVAADGSRVVRATNAQ